MTRQDHAARPALPRSRPLRDWGVQDAFCRVWVNDAVLTEDQAIERAAQLNWYDCTPTTLNRYVAVQKSDPSTP